MSRDIEFPLNKRILVYTFCISSEFSLAIFCLGFFFLHVCSGVDRSIINFSLLPLSNLNIKVIYTMSRGVFPGFPLSENVI